MSAGRAARRVVSSGFAVLASVVASAPLSAVAAGQQRTETASSVTVPVQGSAGGQQPLSGAPEPPANPTAVVPVSARAGRPGATAAPVDPLVLRLKALATAEGEATVELDGARQVVRPGSRLGADTVKSVSTGRIVLERAPDPAKPGDTALVIVTFDGAGRARPRTVWTIDPMASGAPEVKRP